MEQIAIYSSGKPPTPDELSAFSKWLLDMRGIEGRSNRTYVDIVKRATISGNFSGAVWYLKHHRNPSVYAAVRHLLTSLGRDDLVLKWADARKSIRYAEPKPHSLPSLDDVNKVFMALPEEERMIAKFLLFSGARCCEAFETTLGDLTQTEDGSMVIQVKGKGWHQKTLPLGYLKELVAYVKESKGVLEGEKLFYTRSKATPHSKVKMFSGRLNKAAMSSIGKKFPSHDFRRIAIVSLYEMTNDLKACQELAGHKKIDTTVIYARFADKRKLRERINQSKEELLHQIEMRTPALQTLLEAKPNSASLTETSETLKSQIPESPQPKKEAQDKP